MDMHETCFVQLCCAKHSVRSTRSSSDRLLSDQKKNSIISAALPSDRIIQGGRPVMNIFNTLSGKIEPLQTIEPNKLRMYVCGPTVYNLIHIGNARPMIVFDTFRRYMEHKGYK